MRTRVASRLLIRSILPAIFGVGLFVSSVPASAVRATAVLTPVVQHVSLGTPAQADPMIVRSRYVVLAVNALPVPSGVDRQSDLPTAPIRLDLFDDVSVLAIFDRFDPNPRGVTWVGHVQDSEGSTVTLVYGDDGLVQGNVSMLSGTYTIRPAPEDVRAANAQPAGAVHVIAEIDLSRGRRAAPAVTVTPPAVNRLESNAELSIQAADSGNFIDLLVVYTPAAAAGLGGAASLRTRVELLVSETNTSFVNSGVTQRIRLSQIVQVPYQEATYDLSGLTDLENLRNGAGGLAGVAALRDQYSADIVSMISRNDDVFASCGRSYHMADPSVAFAPYAFNVADIWCSSNARYFAQGLGSNMGVRDEWYTDNGITPYTYAHGHVNVGTPGNRWYTLMASYLLCNDADVACAGLMRWSNPSQTLNGIPMGIPPGTRSNCAVGAPDANTCDADARLTLNNTAPIVANFRQAPAAPPGTFAKSSPADNAALSYQFSTAFLSWQWAPFVESYAYCYDTMNNDVCDGVWTPTTSLNGTATGLTPGTTYYWQVQAINAHGPTLANGGTWWRFTVQVSPPEAFNKTAPATGTVGLPLSVTFSWQASSGATSYEYCYDTSDNFVCNGSWTSTTALSASVSGLSAATAYYWQVRAINVSGYVEGGPFTTSGLIFSPWWAFATAGWTSPSYPVTTIAGLAGANGNADATGSSARFQSPNGVAVDQAGTVYVADRTNHTIRKVTPAGVVTTLAGLGGSFGSTDGTGSGARFREPTGVAVDTAGNVYVAERLNSTIRKITPGGVVTTLAGLANSFGFADGTGTAARFSAPEGVVVDAAGTVYVADTGNRRIRKITAAGAVTTLAGNGQSGNSDGTGINARFTSAVAIAIDASGSLFVADSVGHRIRKVTQAGVVTTVAGSTSGTADGIGSGAQFNGPSGIAVDGAGLLYVADRSNHTIRQVTPGGVVTTLAGLAGNFGSADGVGTAARFKSPVGIAIDSAGALYIGDSANYTIRRRSPASVGSGLVQNGSFSAGTGGWQLFATPDNSYVSTAVVNGVFEFTRVPPPAGTSNSATVFQNTGQALPSGTSLLAQFSLGNSSSVRKRISVLVLDHDFSDLSVCTFWLPAQLPMTVYGMRTYTTRAWANASIYFYAASEGTNGGAYRLDDVGLEVQAGGPVQATTCTDPFAATATSDSPGPTLLGNGDFNTGTLAPWGTFGTITPQIAGGVVEFMRETNTPPAGVLFQVTGQAMAANQILTATFQLGNSSPVRKRVTVILHDIDFSDLSACTFWLAPGQPLSDYIYRAYATKPWTNAMISFYPATTDSLQWIRLDNVTLQRTPGTAITGTQCIEPGGG